MPDQKYAEILIRTEEISYYGRRITCEWEGPRNLPVRISPFVDLPELPWPMIELESDPHGRRVMLRTDTHTWWLVWLRHKAVNLLGWINVRLLATARIWGLVDWQPGVPPTWRDLKIFLKRGIRE